ncbi:MAG: Cadherin proteinputative collagen-binding protein [Pedosphaera sp.]|nr:Cadherin proteinputative collagen-binding protein [Pedosphaera sp.]
MKRQIFGLFNILIMAVGLLVAQEGKAHIFGGVVWYDNDCNGIRGGGEPGVSGVIVEVRKCSDNSLVNWVQVDPNGSWTFSEGDFPEFPTVPLGGTYKIRFSNLPPGYGFTSQTYPPPANGTTVSSVTPLTGYTPCFTFTNDVDLTLNNAGLCWGAPPPPNPLVCDDTSTIGFWAGKQGQYFINVLNYGKPNSTALGDWLANNFPCLYGGNAGANNLTGKNNAAVAALFLKFYAIKGQKTDAQMMAAALATYVTDYDLAGWIPVFFDFNISKTGTGAKTYNVGSNGAAIGLWNNTGYSVYELLQQANFLKCAGGFNANAFNSIFEGINTKCDCRGDSRGNKSD